MAGGNVFLGRGKPFKDENGRGKDPKKSNPGRKNEKEERTPDIRPVRREPKEEPFEPGPQYRRKGVRKKNDAWRNLGKTFFAGGGDS